MLPVVGSKTVAVVSSPINLNGPLGTSSNAATVEEVLAVPERDTVSQVMTATAKLDAAIASLTNATKEKISSEQVETLGKELPS